MLDLFAGIVANKIKRKAPNAYKDGPIVGGSAERGSREHQLIE